MRKPFAAVPKRAALGQATPRKERLRAGGRNGERLQRLKGDLRKVRI